jgi:hypothetical protein
LLAAMEETKPILRNTRVAVDTSVWPGAFKAYGISRDAIKVSLSTNILLIVITSFVSVTLNLLFKNSVVLNELLALIVASLFAGSRVYSTVAGLRGKRVEFGDAFRIGLSFTLKAFVLNLLVAISVVVSFILLIVPAFIVTPRLSLAQYFMVDQKMGILDSYKASWHATKGHVSKIWGVVGVTVLMCLPLITIVGVYVSVYFIFVFIVAIAVTMYLTFLYQAALSLLYLNVSQSILAPSSDSSLTPSDTPAA